MRKVCTPFLGLLSSPQWNLRDSPAEERYIISDCKTDSLLQLASTRRFTNAKSNIEKNMFFVREKELDSAIQMEVKNQRIF